MTIIGFFTGLSYLRTAMNIKVRFLSYYQLIAGVDSTIVRLMEPATLQDLIHELEKQIDALAASPPQTTFLVNHQQVPFDYPLKENDEVMALYLIGGG